MRRAFRNTRLRPRKANASAKHGHLRRSEACVKRNHRRHGKGLETTNYTNLHESYRACGINHEILEILEKAKHVFFKRKEHRDAQLFS